MFLLVGLFWVGSASAQEDPLPEITGKPAHRPATVPIDDGSTLESFEYENMTLENFDKAKGNDEDEDGNVVIRKIKRFFGKIVAKVKSILGRGESEEEIDVELDDLEFISPPAAGGLINYERIILTETEDINDTGVVDEDVPAPVSNEPRPINQPPILVVPGSQTFFTDFDNQLSEPIQISDIDAGTKDVQVDMFIAGPAEAMPSFPEGGYVLTHNQVGKNGIRLTGSIQNVNRALGGMRFSQYSGNINLDLSVTVNDLGNTGSGGPKSASGNVAIEVLDFVPSNIGGFVFVDVNNDANKDSNETGLEGVRITLKGTTFRNKSVNIETLTDSSGSYLLSNLQPGEYNLKEEQPPNTEDGVESFQSPVTAAGNDMASVNIPIAGNVDSRNNNFGESKIEPDFITLYDLMNCAVTQNLEKNGASPATIEETVTIKSEDKGQTWTGAGNQWFDISGSTIGVDPTIEMPLNLIRDGFELSGIFGGMDISGKVLLNPDDLTESGFDLTGSQDFTWGGSSYHEYTDISCKKGTGARPAIIIPLNDEMFDYEAMVQANFWK